MTDLLPRPLPSLSEPDPGTAALVALARLLGRAVARAWLAQAGDGSDAGYAVPVLPVPEEVAE